MVQYSREMINLVDFVSANDKAALLLLRYFCKVLSTLSSPCAAGGSSQSAWGGLGAIPRISSLTLAAFLTL